MPMDGFQESINPLIFHSQFTSLGQSPQSSQGPRYPPKRLGATTRIEAH